MREKVKPASCLPKTLSQFKRTDFNKRRHDAKQFLKNEPDTTKACTIIGHVETSFFMGRLQTRLRIIDIL